MNPARSAGVLVSATVLLGGVLLAADPTPFKVGVARTDITPEQPVTMAGYASRKDLSQGVHDPLSARAVAFEQGPQRLVVVSTDILGFYNGTCEVIREAILSECSLRPEQLFLSAIHTHAAPTLGLDSERAHPNNVAYSTRLRGQLVQLTKTALARLAPATVAVARGSSPAGVNRRERVINNDGATEIRLGRNPSGPMDQEVQVLVVRRPGDPAPEAILFGYATHSTALGPRNYQISGDVHGLAEQFVEHYFGGNLIAPGFAGASGNVDPWYRVVPGFRTDRGWLPEPVLLGTMLGEEVVQVVEGAGADDLAGGIESELKVLQLPGRQADASASAERVEFVVTVARVGGVALVGLGGEVFNQIGRAIKDASPFGHTLIITHCNGTAGYLPTPEAYPEGGYEVRSSPFGPEAAGVVIAEVTRMLQDLHATSSEGAGARASQP